MTSDPAQQRDRALRAALTANPVPSWQERAS